MQRKLTRFLDDPQLSRVEFLRKEVSFHWVLGSFVSTLILTVLAYILDADIIGHYGLVLIVLFIFNLPQYRSQNYEKYQFAFLAAIILTTFIFIILFGGYSNSAGLVFVGLTCVFSSILLKSVRTALWLFILYVFTILGLAVLEPYLKPHPDITPGINFIFFIINTIWMSASMIFFIVTYLTERSRFHTAETQKLKELDEAKNQLFTNITHEFRTPITLISGIAEQVKNREIESDAAMIQIQRQSQRLLKLINQILDLAKIETNSLEVHFIQDDIVPFIKYIGESFQSAADSKGINFKTSIEMNSMTMDYDPDKLEIILFNLLSNAIKFTPSGGSVELRAEKADGILKISVRDSGIGISDNEFTRIFDRFYQVKLDQYHEGNGIGLTVVKEFLNLLNGQITVESQPGEGSVFCVQLPVTNQAPVQEFVQKSTMEVGAPPTETSSDDLPLLLIIDDNPDMLNFLSGLLKRDYKILTSSNGKEGLEVAFEQIPDIIISDVMMPEMDGFEFLKKIKSDMKTSHIPVLFLTAKADHPSRLEGLELGAEAYLVKPFDREELFIRLKKLLELRKILHRRFQELNFKPVEPDNAGHLEERFMRKVQGIIDNHLDDESFSVQDLCRSLGMSHTQLYRKFSAVTDITVNKYIRRYRLHKAMELIKNSDLNVTQIALEVGLSNPSYFSRVFTEEFGINPSKAKQATY
ncbi:MAG: response regulator [Cyclobacteriaceae bacterium]